MSTNYKDLIKIYYYQGYTQDWLYGYTNCLCRNNLINGLEEIDLLDYIYEICKTDKGKLDRN